MVMKMLMKLRNPRANKEIPARLEKGDGIIKNISTSGGFLKTAVRIKKGDSFHVDIRVMGCKTVSLFCESRRCEPAGVGFRVLDIEKSKRDFFNRYVADQFIAIKTYGDKRVFTTKIMVTLRDTNVFGNVYFSNFIEYQGIIREKFLLSSVPNLNEFLTNTGVRLVTVDTYNRFIKNAYFGDTLLVELTTSDIKAASAKLNILFRNDDTGEILGKGFQTFCVVKSNGKVIRIPDELLRPLDYFQEVIT